MNTRTRTLATLFTLAMTAMLLGAAVTTQMRPAAALARTADPEPATALQRTGGAPVSLDTFRDVARAYTAGVVNINTSKEVRSSRGRDPFHEFFGDDFMERFFGERTIRFQRELDRLLEILAGFLERSTLRIRSGQLLHKGGIPFGHLEVDGGPVCHRGNDNSHGSTTDRQRLTATRLLSADAARSTWYATSPAVSQPLRVG